MQRSNSHLCTKVDMIFQSLHSCSELSVSVSYSIFCLTYAVLYYVKTNEERPENWEGKQFCFYRLIGQKVNDLNRIETLTTTLSI